jgi:hypothetical protein
MDSATDLERTMRRARRAYELGRARRALLGFLPVLLLVGAACLFSDRASWTAAFGLGMFLFGSVMLWYGRDLKRAVLPGVAAGSVPLILVLCARHFGHLCTGASCTSLCMQACAGGGVLAGLAVASVGNARRSGPGFWLAASGMALLTGAMACACLGISGVVGLTLGYGAGVVPGLLQRVFAKPAR